jgi:hypothetical protein
MPGFPVKRTGTQKTRKAPALRENPRLGGAADLCAMASGSCSQCAARSGCAMENLDFLDCIQPAM